MKHLTLFLAAFWLANSLFAQNEKPVVIVSVSGKVALLSKGQTKAVAVEAGAVAKNSGQLKLSKNAKVVLYCEGQFKTESGKKTLDLATVCSESGASRVVNADYDFGNKLMAAVEMVAVGQQRGDGWATALGDKSKSGDGWGTALGDKSKSGDGWGTALGDKSKSGDGWGTALGDKSKSGDGWGGKGTKITPVMPFGKIRSAKTTFFWSKPATDKPYRLSIMDEAGNTSFSTVVKDTFAVVNIPELNLSPTQIYQWKITVEGDASLESAPLEFGLSSEEDWNATLSEIKQSPLSQNAGNAALNNLVEAAILEKNEWFYEAHLAYARTPGNKADQLTKMMHGAFWMRYGFKKLAEKAMK
jgi:hypothetical protein